MAGRPPGSQNKDKPFATALRMELAALEDGDPRSLRGLARKLLSSAADGDNTLAAIKEIADRLDGKPAQESTVTIDDKRDATDWSREELVAFLGNAEADSAGASETKGRRGKSGRVH